MRSGAASLLRYLSTVLPVPLPSPVCHTCVCDPQENHVYPHGGAFDCTSAWPPPGKGHLIQIRSLYIVGNEKKNFNRDSIPCTCIEGLNTLHL